MQILYSKFTIVKILKPLWIKEYYRYNLILYGTNG